SSAVAYVPYAQRNFLRLINGTTPTEFDTLSLHDALPISSIAEIEPIPQGLGNVRAGHLIDAGQIGQGARDLEHTVIGAGREIEADRKSTRLNSSHVKISYAVFCLKKKNRIREAG